MDINAADVKEYIDVELALPRVLGNKALYKQMLTLFLESSEFDAFEDALAAGDNAEAGAKIHGIKGISGSLSMTALFETSSLLNEQLKAGPADPGVLAEYRVAYVKTREYAEQMVASSALG
ncbi:MAG: hypothetical protein FWE94_06070 [Coriobacteriia bacterium]|nr:hypothetical protein [Coriobacteriia bacterium]